MLLVLLVKTSWCFIARCVFESDNSACEHDLICSASFFLCCKNNKHLILGLHYSSLFCCLYFVNIVSISSILKCNVNNAIIWIFLCSFAVFKHPLGADVFYGRPPVCWCFVKLFNHFNACTKVSVSTDCRWMFYFTVTSQMHHSVFMPFLFL